MSEDKIHRGWCDGPIAGLSPIPGPNADLLYAMGFRPEDGDGQFTILKDRPGPDDDVARACFAPFKRNLIGFPGVRSQYDLTYVLFKYGYPSEVDELLGTSKARSLLQKKMVDELEKLAQTHPVAVWRLWPEIGRSDDAIMCYMRLHVMTEAQYQSFAQNE